MDFIIAPDRKEERNKKPTFVKQAMFRTTNADHSKYKAKMFYNDEVEKGIALGNATAGADDSVGVYVAKSPPWNA